MTFILGLTGSIGMGKSTTAAIFRSRGVPVHDADEAVHRLYRGRAAPLVEAEFPGTTVDGVVDRAKLGAKVIGHPDRMAALERLIHPLVRADRDDLLARARAAGAPLVVFDVPLLYETGADKECDAVLVVTAAPEIQRERVLARPDMTPERFALIHVKQMPDAEKRRRADFIVDTGRGLADAEAQVDAIIASIAARTGETKD
ncbi:dephospho-CoA kinase [Chelatococcus asaccharovorans]|jgi:dephospho-CoA kinase|uniref:Dephospho-CoA kinase n=1 Tax=Chelatococcus asaccharovorans TaxID=28210 RepID=A0A2V3U6M9_9HYPH|nr:dephospho-CoA kinase [Chelatococcus asaccharovorans]MBS7705839.1 dephospho-CoA kinase [Chelatococcus asaccharovorans]PXW58861.1 dephospho-CoA kinase [Chelatococcus asaccharovorans]CAH1658215.1 Dephospho-CoA kinase [Chelatococcus asaccharovorans]CAH1684569.1 Dephospho-CoA kinase [Chelatococcus asaccharovorans]